MQHGVLKRIPNKTTARRQGAGSRSTAVASLVRVARQLFQTLSLHHIARSFISLSTRTAPHPHVLVPAHIGEVQSVPVDLCAAGLSSTANAANAMVTVDILGGHKTFTAMCGDNPLTEDVVEDGGVEIGHLGLCP